MTSDHVSIGEVLKHVQESSKCNRLVFWVLSKQLINLKVPNIHTKFLMKNIHQNVIKYLYLHGIE